MVRVWLCDGIELAPIVLLLVDLLRRDKFKWTRVELCDWGPRIRCSAGLRHRDIGLLQILFKFVFELVQVIQLRRRRARRCLWWRRLGLESIEIIFRFGFAPAPESGADHQLQQNRPNTAEHNGADYCARKDDEPC